MTHVESVIEIVGASPYPQQRHMNMESIYEYGSRAGFWRLHRMFTQRRLTCTGKKTYMYRQRSINDYRLE